MDDLWPDIEIWVSGQQREFLDNNVSSRSESEFTYDAHEFTRGGKGGYCLLFWGKFSESLLFTVLQQNILLFTVLGAQEIILLFIVLRQKKFTVYCFGDSPLSHPRSLIYVF